MPGWVKVFIVVGILLLVVILAVLLLGGGKHGIALCKQLPLQDKMPCYEETGAQSANMLAPDALQALCETSEQGYVAACRTAAGMS